MMSTHPFQRLSSKAAIALAAAALLYLIAIAPPASLGQEPPTATPDAEGVIYTEVKPNDSLWSIAARAGITLQELLDLNGLSEDAIIQPGDQLIIGHGLPPATPTVPAPTPTVTATRPPPTPTATASPPPRTAICLLAFMDLDKNGRYEGNEPLRAAVAFTVFNEETVVANYITDGLSEPFCVEDLQPGKYKVTRSVGRHETLTTAGDWSLTLTRGNILNLEFGSYADTDVTGAGVPANSTSLPGPVPLGTETANDNGQQILIIPIVGMGTALLVLLVAVLFLIRYYRRSVRHTLRDG
ncbi:MAG: LysM domain-containing protein [Anaerolineae bacterium]